MGSLEAQLKTVRIVITDMISGSILMTSDKGGDISVVSFKYLYDDEDPDECTIKLQTSDPVAFDKIGIGRSSKLQVTWGYISGPMTYSTIVVIRDLQSSYGNKLITTELICSDLLFYANTSRSNDVGEADMVTFLEAQFSKRYNIVIRDGSTLILQLPKIADEKQPARDAITNPDLLIYPNTSGDPYYNTDSNFLRGLTYFNKKPSSDIPDDPWGVDEKNEIRDWLLRKRGVVSANRSQMTVLRDIFKECPKGPWYVTGHGETLMIHNRNFIDAPIRVYKYRGENSKLIDFKAKTKYDQFEKNRITHDFYDQEKRKFYFIDAYIDELFSMVTFKEKFNNKSMTEVDFKFWLEKWIDLMKAYEKWHVTRAVYTIYNPQTKERTNIRVANSPAIWGAAIKEETSAQDILKHPHPYLRGPNGFDPNHGVVLSGFIYTRPLQFIDDRSNFVNNEMRKMEMEKEEAKIIVEGDPILQCNMRIQILNVHWQHKGLYYIKKCTHVLTRQGYKTELECIKVISTSKMRTGLTTESVTVDAAFEDPQIQVEEQYAQEQKLYGDPIVIETIDPVRPLSDVEASYAGTTGWSRPTTAIKKVTTVEQELSRENFIELIMELKYNRNSKVVPNVEDN